MKNSTLFIEQDPSDIESSLDEQLSNLDEFVKWNGSPSGSQVDYFFLLNPFLNSFRSSPAILPSGGYFQAD